MRKGTGNSESEPLVSASSSSVSDFWKSQMTFEDENQTLSDGTPRGLVGLFNQGNSCYMNAAIQALSNCPPLREYFRSYLPSTQASRDANGLPPVKKPVSDAFQELLMKIWSNHQVRGNAIGPTLFSYRIKDRCAQFRGFTQQDAQEFIRCFLDILHQELRHPASIKFGNREVGNSLSSSCSSSQDELNLGENDHFETADSGLSSDAGDSKPDAPKKVSTSSPKPQSSPERARSPSESTTKSKKGDVQHSRSIITDVFDGELVSTVKCMTCHHLSNTRETFQDISLSIPTVEQISLLREGSTIELESSSSSSEAESTVDESTGSVDMPSPESKKKQIMTTANQFSYAYWLIFFAKSWLIDSWLNHIINAYKFMFSSNISLEDCLYAFFSADHLHGEDMYSCEKCSKLRNGVKQCRLTKLPEILCIHLKRFRHELLYNSKVGTRVTFPLYDLDMKPFVMHSVLEQADPEEFSTEYDLVAFVSHRGAGAEFGHYVAFCRNDVDGNWYEFDDSFVSPIPEADVMSREAYVLFYQKKGTPSTEAFKERISQALNNMKEPSPSAFYISSEWLFRFRTFSDPGPISNTDFLCEHLGLNPLANRSQAVSIPGNLWNMLFERYSGGPPCDRILPCQVCLKRVIEIYARKQLELNNFAKLEKSVRYMAQLPLNVVAYSWFEQWEAFVTQFDRNPPGPIRNEALLQRHRDGSTILRRGINYKSLTRDQWTYLHSVYGGGPEVFKTYDKQPNQDEVLEICRKCDEERRRFEEKERATAAEPIVETPESDDEEDEDEKPKSKKMRLRNDSSKAIEESDSAKTDVEMKEGKFSEFIIITYDGNGVTNNSSPDNVNDFVDLYNKYTSVISGDYKTVATSYQGNDSNIDALQKLVGDNSGSVLTSSDYYFYVGPFAEKIANANKMRGVLWGVLGTLLAVLCLTEGKAFPEVLDIDSEHTIRIKRALQQMDIKKTFHQVQQSDVDAAHLESHKSHGLVSSNAAGFGNPTCDPGFTGSDCEFPICDVTNRHDHENPLPQKITVDFYYATNATQRFWIYVDLTMHGQEFQLQSDSGPIRPMMTLVNISGGIIYPTAQEIGQEQSVYTFEFTPPGSYFVQLSADDPAGSLLATYNAWTYLTTEIGGVAYNGYEDTAKKNDFPNFNLTFFTNTPTVFIAASVGLEFPGSLATASFFGGQAASPHNVKLLLRYGCHYPYYTGDFYCPSEGYFFARIRGYDFEGHTFVRSHGYLCEIGLPPTTTPANTQPTTPPGNVTCFNGGIPITGSNGGQTCYCNALYTGNYCGTPLCMNGGVPRSSLCICPDGFSGSHCQNVQCTDDAGSGFLVGSPVLTFIVRTRKSMASIITQVSNAVQQITSELEYDPPYVSKFGLILFNNNNLTANMYYTASDMVGALNAAAQTSDTSGNCTDFFFIPVLEALTTFIISNKSPLYVVSDGLPEDLAFAEEVSRLNSYFMSPINFIYIEPDPSTGCPPFDYESPGFRAVAETSFRFSGIASFVNNANVANVSQLLYTHMSNTYHKSHLMFSDDQRVCQNVPSYIPISVDALFHQLTVVIEGANITNVQFNNPDGSVAQVTGSFSLGAVNIYWVTGLHIGTWTVTPVVGSINFPCSVRVYAVEDPTPTTNGQDYHMVYGITPTITLDAPERQPLIGFPQSIVAHIENYPVREPWNVNAELIVYTDGGRNGEGRNLVMASNGVWRSGCSYEIWFPPFYCFREGINLYFVIYVKDMLGNQIQRSGVFYCAANRVTPPPPPGTCANGGIPVNGTNGGNTTCLCQPGWTGDYCTTRVCYNNGTLNPAGYCQCPPGTGGESCEYLRCLQQNEQVNFNIHNRHMMFVLDITNRNAPALNDLSRYIGELIRDIGSSHRDWISRYFVVGINSTGSHTLGTAFGGDVGRVESIFTSAAQMAANSNDNSTYIPLYEGLMRHMYELNSNSFINVFTVAAPDESNFTNVIEGYDFVLAGRHLMNTFVATDNTGNYLSGNSSDWSIVRSLTGITTGRFMTLQPSNFFIGLKLIPTWYSSQVVYYKTFPDCTYNGSIFAPIDTFAQSIQIYLNGKNAGNNGASSTLYVQLPNGTMSNLATAVLTDTANGFGVYDVRRPCDAGWEMSGPSVPYCFRAFQSNQPWNAARQICTDAGGFLVDDMNQAKDDFISKYTADKATWIGLNSLNGTWTWDRGVGQNGGSYDGTSFGPWANGDSNIDPNNPCVYRGSDKMWHKTNCDTASYFYVCQKYQYTQEFIPNDMNDNDVPAGRWQVSFSSPGECTIEVRVQSSLQVFSGFVTHVLDDYALPDGISNSTDNRIITHMTGIVSVNHIPYLRYAQIMDGKNGTLYSAATYDYRIGCSYEYLSQNFICPNGGNTDNRFAVIHIGEDQSGLPFQRITAGVCQAPRTTCRNGLYWNGQCVCDEYYQGTYCEVPICVNGGLVNTADNTCQCPSGYAGRNCQFDYCFTPVNTTFSNDGKAFIVVIETTTQNQAAVKKFGGDLTAILNNVTSATSSNWFSQYILVTFDSNGVMSKGSATNVNDFVSLYNTNTGTLSNNNNCNLPIFATIATVATSDLPSQSIMYLVTTGGSSSDDTTNSIYTAFNNAANTDVMINYVLIVSDSCNGEVTTGSSMYVSDLAVATDGNTYLIDAGEISNFAGAHLPTLYNGSLLGTPSLTNQSHQCTETVFFFPVDREVQTVYLYIYAEFGEPSIVSPDGGTMVPKSFYADKNLFFYSFPSAGQGIYTLSISDPGVCMVQVRVQGGSEIYPNFITVPSINGSVASNLDNSSPVPNIGQNLLVIHMPDERVEVQYAQFWPTRSTLGEIQYVQLYRRFNCFYEWYSDPFTCDEDGYFITVFGIGSRGAPWARQFYTKCSGYNGSSTLAPPTTGPTPSPTTTSPTTTTTGNTGTTASPPTTATTSAGQTTTTSKYYPVNADVIFIIDISQALTQSQYQDTTTFILNALNQYNVGYQKGVQVGILAIYGDNDGFASTISGFNGISDYNTLKNALANGYPSDASASGTGQSALTQALKLVMSPQFKGAGYRNTTQNHLIVYITTTSTPIQPSIDQASLILSSGDYKIVAISYQGDGSNSNVLQQLVGNNAGCVLTSANQGDYTGAFAQSFTDKIFNANSNGGSYC